MSETIEELLAACSSVYTREKYEADRARIVARLCEKHSILEIEIEALIREHRYEHSNEDPEQAQRVAVAAVVQEVMPGTPFMAHQGPSNGFGQS